MIRRALIIYCDKTESGDLEGPAKDNENLLVFLKSSLGGEWYSNEIKSLNNPTIAQVENLKVNFLDEADYSFIVFSGHGCINTLHRNLQYCELADGDISVQKLICKAKRQAIIFDSCRGFTEFVSVEMRKAVLETKIFSATSSTRHIFNKAVLAAEEGITILYSSSENQSSGDSDEGGLYLLSLLAVAKAWSNKYEDNNILTLKDAHDRAVGYLKENYLTLQVPIMAQEKRNIYYPFAVKLKRLTY